MRCLVALLLLSLAATRLPAAPTEQLLDAAYRGERERLADLLRDGAEANQLHGGAAALHVGAEWGHTEIVELLLGAGAKVDAVDSCGRTALIWAAENGHTAIAQRLIAARCDVNWHDTEGISALSVAAGSANDELVKLLLKSGAKVLQEDAKPLRQAVETGKVETVRALLAARADPCVRSDREMTPLQAAAAGGSVEVMKVLAEAALEHCDDLMPLSNALIHAAENGRVRMMEYLLPFALQPAKRKGKREPGDEEPKSPIAAALKNAIEDKQTEAAKFLLDHATDVPPRELGPLLVTALQYKQNAIFDKLLESGAAVHVTGDNGRTPLLQSSYQGDLAKSEMLLAGGASTKVADDTGVTPLLAACRAGNAELVQLLLNKGSTTTELDEDERGPVINAAMRGRAAVCELLAARGCDLNAIDPKTGYTALHFAAENQDFELAKTLLALKVKTKIKDQRGKTARRIAEENGASRSS